MRKPCRIARPLLALVITGGAMAVSLFTVVAGDETRPANVQAAKDGLTVTVTPAQALFGADEQPAFDVTFTNQRDSAFRLSPGVSMVDSWTIIAEETASGASYRLDYTVQFLRHVLEITTLGAKESKTVHLDFRAFQFIHLQHEQTEKPLAHLPAGKYRLTITMKLEPVFDTPESVKPAAWIGELKTDAVTFQVAGK